MTAEGELNINIRFLLVLRGVDIDRLLSDIGFEAKEIADFHNEFNDQMESLPKQTLVSRLLTLLRLKSPTAADSACDDAQQQRAQSEAEAAQATTALTSAAETAAQEVKERLIPMQRGF